MMKNFTVAAVAVMTAADGQNLLEAILGDTAQQQDIVTDGPLRQSVSKNKFGCVVEESIFSHPHVEKVIKAPLLPYHLDYVQ